MFKLTPKQFTLLLITLGLIIFILICRWHSGVAEWYMQRIYPVIAAVLSFISSIIPFSLFDIFITLYIIAFIVSIVLLIIGKIRVRRWLLSFLISIFSIIIWFYMSWGISYFRPDFYTRTNVSQIEFDSTSFKFFLSHYIEELNSSYISVKNIDYNEVDKAIEEEYLKLSTKLNISYPCGKRPLKRMIYEKWITKSGVSGYFGPFFNEVHTNRYPLVIEQPNIIAHEKAHQFGVSSEAECNLYAYIVCTTSPNSHVRYSGYFEALGYVLGNTRKLFPNEFIEWRDKINPEIIADLNASYQHWMKAIDPQISEMQRKIYDAYLKTNKIESGVKNYSEMVALLVSWHNNQISEK